MEFVHKQLSYVNNLFNMILAKPIAESFGFDGREKVEYPGKPAKQIMARSQAFFKSRCFSEVAMIQKGKNHSARQKMMSTIPAPVAASGISACVPRMTRKMTTKLPSVFIIVLSLSRPCLMC